MTRIVLFRVKGNTIYLARICHPERSEGSLPELLKPEIFRYAQDDRSEETQNDSAK